MARGFAARSYMTRPQLNSWRKASTGITFRATRRPLLLWSIVLLLAVGIAAVVAVRAPLSGPTFWVLLLGVWVALAAVGLPGVRRVGLDEVGTGCLDPPTPGRHCGARRACPTPPWTHSLACGEHRVHFGRPGWSRHPAFATLPHLRRDAGLPLRHRCRRAAARPEA